MIDSAFYYFSKFIWMLISPDSLLLLMIIASLILLFTGRLQLARLLLLVISVVGLTVAIFPVGEWVLYPLESRYEANPVLPEEIDGVIVLGGAGDQRMSSQWDQVEFGRAVERYLTLFSLAVLILMQSLYLLAVRVRFSNRLLRRRRWRGGFL